MIIRNATLSDIPQIAKLQDELLLPVTDGNNGFLVSAFTPEQYEYFLSKYEYFYVAIDADILVGVIMAYHSTHVSADDINNSLIKSTIIGEFVLVKQIFISKKHSGKGIARKLYNKLFDEAGSYLPFVCAIVMEPFNQRSCEFHKRLGFIEYLNFIPVADKDGIVRKRSAWIIAPKDKEAISYLRLHNAFDTLEDDLGDVMSNRANALISLYQHEDNLNWTKFGLQTTVLFALFASFTYFNDKDITENALPILVILALWGIIVNILFMIKINSGIYYMNAYKLKIKQYDELLTFYFPKVAKIFNSNEYISKKSITCRLMYLFSMIGLISWICVSMLLILKALRYYVFF